MSSGPNQLLVKRKRDEPGPDKLILEPPTKRTLTVGAAAQSNALQYVRVDRELAKEGGKGQDGARDCVKQGGEEAQMPSKNKKRVFHLSRRQGEGTVRRNLRQRKQNGGTASAMFATFEESRGRSVSTSQSRPLPAGSDPEDEEQAAPLKRPGRKLAVPRTGNVSKQLQGNESTESREKAESLAKAMNKFAIEELDEPPKQKLTSLPRFATRRRDLRPQSATVQAPEPRIRDDEMDLDSDGDYVYDTYILAPLPAESQANGSSAPDLTGDNIGYLVINDEDQALWEAYIEDEPSDKDWDSDDADSNAEDYYGADYPEDELASDDEYDRGAYNYRRNGGSDDESWDEDTGAYSGDEEDSAPWKNKMYGRLAKSVGVEVDDEDD